MKKTTSSKFYQTGKCSQPSLKRLVFLGIIICYLIFGFISCSFFQSKKEQRIVLPTPMQKETPLVEIDPNLDFSVFQHKNPEHQRLPCLLCHKQEDNSPKLKFAEHISCSGCHIQQFEDKQNKICTICHTDTEKGGLKNFPTLKSFNASFSHSKHIKQTDCKTCHQPAGVTFTMLSRSNSHATCFQCHQPEKMIGEKNIGSCDTCHQSGNPPKPVARANVNFAMRISHSLHKIACTACHSVNADTSRGNQVSASIVGMMHSSNGKTKNCASCHNNQTAFGGNDAKDCRRCHQGVNFAVPFTTVKSNFAMQISHSKHKIACTACHTNSGGKVMSIVASMHFPPKNAKSCATCHNNQGVFGGDDFKDCKRCHQGTNFNLPIGK